MSWKNIATVVACALLATPALAAPILSVEYGGMDGGNHLWNVMASPDDSLFNDNDPQGVGGSLAFELGFEAADGNILDIVHDTTNIEADANAGQTIWGWETMTGDFPEGIQIGTGGDASQAFAAVGSTYFTDAGPFDILTITTAGSTTALAFGGRYNADGTMGDAGTLNLGRIAQDGTNFHEDDYSGIVNVPGGPIDGDYDDSGQVAQGDLDLVLLNWGDTVPPDPVPDGWINQQPMGLIGQGSLDGVLLNWGNTSGSGAGASVAAVPEPSSLLLTGLALGAIALLSRRER